MIKVAAYRQFFFLLIGIIIFINYERHRYYHSNNLRRQILISIKKNIVFIVD